MQQLKNVNASSKCKETKSNRHSLFAPPNSVKTLKSMILTQNLQNTNIEELIEKYNETTKTKPFPHLLTRLNLSRPTSQELEGVLKNWQAFLDKPQNNINLANNTP